MPSIQFGEHDIEDNCVIHKYVLLDDREDRLGSMLADMELIGVPQRIVVGERGLKEGKVEYQRRTETGATQIGLNEIISHVKSNTCKK